MSVLSKLSVVNAWKNADCVCFDVDSTVCRNEAIDDLAKFVGVGAQVEQMLDFILNESSPNNKHLLKLLI